MQSPELIDIVGLKRPTTYAAIEAGTFPKPVNIGPRCRRARRRCQGGAMSRLCREPAKLAAPVRIHVERQKVACKHTPLKPRPCTCHRQLHACQRRPA